MVRMSRFLKQWNKEYIDNGEQGVEKFGEFTKNVKKKVCGLISLENGEYDNLFQSNVDRWKSSLMFQRKREVLPQMLKCVFQKKRKKGKK